MAVREIKDLPPDVTREATERRTPNSKTWERPGGRRVTKIFPDPIHYLSGGSLLDIDPVPVRQGNDFIVNTAPYTVTAALNRIGLRFQNDAGADIDTRLIAISGTTLRDLTLNLSPEPRQRDNVGNQLYYPSVLPDLDFYIQFHNIGATLHMVMRSATAPRQFTFSVREVSLANMDVIHQPFGRDNANNDPLARAPVDMRREIEATFSQTTPTPDGNAMVFEFTSEWTGRVFQVDNITRIKTLTTDVHYPVWMR